jgi:hypothetical protein
MLHQDFTWITDKTQLIPSLDIPDSKVPPKLVIGESGGEQGGNSEKLIKVVIYRNR